MPSSKSKNTLLPFLCSRLILLSLLLICLSLFTSDVTTSQPPHVLPHKESVATVKPSSRIVPQVQADDKQEDYCVTVPVIMYHHVQPLYLSEEKEQESLSVGVEYFDMHMNYLSSEGYTSLSAEKLVSALLNREELPVKSVVVTFDDGYEDNYLYAYPILRKYNITGNFFISTGLIGKKDYMTWQQLGEMAESTLVKIYNHTTTHVDVGNSSLDITLQEIGQAKNMLKQKLGITSPIFAYPYGSSSESAKQALTSLGYVGAFTTQHGFTQCRSQILELHRDHVGNLPLSSYGL